jgi:dihydroneopterin aldolase
MAAQLVIERLEFQGHCGVTAEERQIPQPIAVDLELHYPVRALETAAQSGDIAQAVDYAKVADRVLEVATGQHFRLVETLAERLVTLLLAEFPVSRVRLWVRKTAPPLKTVNGSVGVRLDRARPLQTPGTPPARFLLEQGHRLPKGTVLDVACGSGRNALYLATQGSLVEGVDRDEQALAAVSAEAKQRSLTNLTLRCLDLEAEPDIPKERYDGIVVFFFLYRPLVPVLVQALKPGGVLVYETFLIDNHLRQGHPRRREFCLAHNELLHLAAGLRILLYDEGEREGEHADGLVFTARLVARKENA